MTHAMTRAVWRPLWTTVLALVAIALSPAAAQEYPVRPVKIIVASPPGGGFDVVGRLIANQLAQQTGQQFVVENRPGAGTLVGTRAAAAAPADGYTLLVGALPNIVLNMGLYKQPGYDAQADFVPLGMAVTYSYALVTRPDFPHGKLAELVGSARANPGKYTMAVPGLGTGQHLAASFLQSEAGVNFHQVQYKGAQAVYPDLISGRIDLFFDNSGTARPYIDSGKVKALVISSRERNPALPAIPTVKETGVTDFEMESWFGIFGRRGTAAPIVNRLRAEMAKAVAADSVRGPLEKAGGRSFIMPAGELDAFVAAELRRWTALLRKTGLQLE